LLLKARIRNVSEWKAILNAIGDVVEDAMFICNMDGVTFRGMDSAHIALLDVTFPKSSFEILESKTSFFGVKVEDFKKVMYACGNSDTVDLEVENSGAVKISVTGSLKMEFNLKLIEKTEVNTPIPKVDYKTKVSVEPETLSRVLTNLQPISDYVSIISTFDRVQFSGQSDIGSAKIDLEKGNPELRYLETLGNTSATYSLGYMAKMIKNVGRAAKNLNLEYSNKNPIHMSFEMPSLVKVEYYLAPRVED
jgi:proliferating cell nuclear antigen